ncbi:MAG: serine hydrolase, partial [Clostridia bacterium]|nr:serine hydrolase [Clostridia bacterium]
MKRFTRLIIIAAAAAFLLTSCKIKDVIDPGPTAGVSPSPAVTATPDPAETFWNVPVFDTLDESELETYLLVLLAENPGNYGLHYTNLTTGSEIGIRDSEPYIAAESIALPVNLSLYKMLEDGLTSMAGQLEVTQADKIGTTGDVSNAEIGIKFTLEELSAASLKQNDMTALAMLIRYITPDYINEFITSIGAKNTNVPGYTSPGDMAVFLETLYKSEENNPGIYSALSVNLLADQPILSAPLPQELNTISKIGMYGSLPSYNDSMTVYGDTPYVLSIYTENVLKTEAVNIMESASRAIYSFLNYGKLPL